ncbi:MAG: type II toxin-antitoxin system mRNA interferase toxin, RelE/StbE family [Patescibacteria group bacterium]
MSVSGIKTTSLFERHYRKLPKKIKELAKQKEHIFRDNPFAPSLETHKLQGREKELWAFSINRKYRIKFAFLEHGWILFVDAGLHDIYE